MNLVRRKMVKYQTEQILPTNLLQFSWISQSSSWRRKGLNFDVITFFLFPSFFLFDNPTWKQKTRWLIFHANFQRECHREIVIISKAFMAVLNPFQSWKPSDNALPWQPSIIESFRCLVVERRLYNIAVEFQSNWQAIELGHVWQQR